jgi:hypothetical protein
MPCNEVDGAVRAEGVAAQGAQRHAREAGSTSGGPLGEQKQNLIKTSLNIMSLSASKNIYLRL